jgi:hypothetical protein
MEQAKGKAYIAVNQTYNDVQAVAKRIRETGDVSEGGGVLSARESITRDGDYVILGFATYEVHMLSDKEIQSGQVKSLEELLQKHLAESQVKTNFLRDQISKLLAITDGTVIDQ